MKQKVRKDLESGVDEPDPPLSREWRAEIARRVRDSVSPIRYCVVSAISPRFLLYYHVEGNCYAMKPEAATLIKSREVAEGIRLALGRDRLEVVKFTTKGGRVRRLTALHPLLPDRRPKRRRTRS